MTSCSRQVELAVQNPFSFTNNEQARRGVLSVNLYFTFYRRACNFLQWRVRYSFAVLLHSRFPDRFRSFFSSDWNARRKGVATRHLSSITETVVAADRRHVDRSIDLIELQIHPFCGKFKRTQFREIFSVLFSESFERVSSVQF